LDLGRRSWIAVQSVSAVCRSNYTARAWANTGAVRPILIAQNVAHEMEIAAYGRSLFQSDRRFESVRAFNLVDSAHRILSFKAIDCCLNVLIGARFIET